MLALLLACGSPTTAPKPDTGEPAEIVDSGESPAIDADDDGYAVDVDCDDTDPARHPDAAESCNDADDDCDGAVDEDATDAVV
jgi:hypothetical protein